MGNPLTAAENTLAVLNVVLEECRSLSEALLPTVHKMTVDAVINALAADQNITASVDVLSRLRDALSKCHPNNLKPAVEFLNILEKEVSPDAVDT